MEIKDVIIVVVLLAILTVIVAVAKNRKKQFIGYLSNVFKDNYNFRVGILNLDYSKTFSIIIENKGKQEIVIKDIYIEIKEGNKYNKFVLPNTAFDNTKELIIPAEKTGGAMMDEKEFKKIFSQDTDIKAVVVFADDTKIKSQIMQIIGKKKELKLK